MRGFRTGTHVIALAGILLAGNAIAQVEVLEPGMDGYDDGGAPVVSPTREPRESRPSRAAPSAPKDGNSGSEMFYQLQVMQEELMKLRGIVEEQGEQLRQLKQQRLDDYISIDRRLTALGSGGVPPASAPAGVTAPTAPVDVGTTVLAPTPDQAADAGQPIDTRQALPNPEQRPVATPPPRTATRAAVPTANEERAYQNAYDLVKARKFPDATTAFNDFLSQYPDGAYAGNAHYWLGELYLLDGDSPAARKHFEKLLSDYPDNRKLPDAMFKLGRIYDQEGDRARGKALLERVVKEYAKSDSSAPRLASEYLKQNF